MSFFYPENWMQARNLDHSFIHSSRNTHTHRILCARDQGKKDLDEAHLSSGKRESNQNLDSVESRAEASTRNTQDPSLKELCKSQETHLWAKCGQGLLICKLSSL